MKTSLPTVLAGLALLLGWLALAFTVFGPTYSTASTTIDANGITTSSTGSASLLETGLNPIAALFLSLFAACYLAVFLGAVAVDRGRAGGRWAMMAACMPLLTLGAISMGLVLALPATLLAATATVLAFRTPERKP